MNVIYKYNNGNGATICNKCRTIIATGNRVERFYCDKCQEEFDDSIKRFYETMEKEVHQYRSKLNN